MTVKIEVECDGGNCHATHEIEEDNDNEIEHIGWGIDYDTGFHYCKNCWPIVQKELAENN